MANPLQAPWGRFQSLGFWCYRNLGLALSWKRGCDLGTRNPESPRAGLSGVLSLCRVKQPNMFRATKLSSPGLCFIDDTIFSLDQHLGPRGC